jgi:hypothetical protein
MTKDKALKRDVRARMEKTGESYTTARHFLLDEHLPSDSSVSFDDSVELEAEPIAPSLPPRVAEPGMSDEAIQRATGKTWDELFLRLDEWGATQRTHPEIAVFAEQEFAINGWWAQNVTVGYERARGMRKVNERVDGFSVNASRTFNVPVERLYAALAEDDQRSRWLEPELIRVRTTTANKAWRCEIVSDASRVEFRLTAKTPEKTSVAMEHSRLSSEEDVSTWRAFWKDHLDRLTAQLA